MPHNKATNNKQQITKFTIMKKILFVALAAVGMTACVQNEELAVSNSNAIKFDNVYVDNATKAAIDGSYTAAKGNLDHFNVWATIKNGSGETNIFDGEAVTKNGGAWSYDASHTQYWIPGNDYKFVGVVDGTVEVTDDACKLPVTIATQLEEQKDVLYATHSRPYNAGDIVTPVHFNFEHLLSKVKFTVKNVVSTSLSGYTYTVESIQILNADKAGVYTIENGTWEAEGTYAAQFGAVTSTSNVENAEASHLAYGQQAESNYERLVLPQTGKTLEIKINYTLHKDAWYQQYDSNVIAELNIVKGKAYNFILTLGNPGAPIEFTADVKDWETENVEKEIDYSYDANTNTYSVATARGLQEVAAKINAGELTANVVLMNDIVLPATRSAEGNWTPLGLTTKNSYRGTFNGNNYAIENMVCNGIDVAGLVGYTYSGAVKNLTIKNATINGNHFAAGIVAWVNNYPGNTKVPFVVENCHVINSTITSTPELVDGAYDNGDKVGGLIGAAWFSKDGAHNAGTKVANCSVKNTTIKAYRDLGGLFGLAQGVYAENCVLENVTVEQDLTNGYQPEVPTTVGNVVGRDAGYNVINGCEYVSTAEALAAALTSDKENIAVALVKDIEVSITSLGTQTAGSGEYKLGGEQTKNITIDLCGNKLTIATTYWSVLGAKNANALFTIKNGTMTSSQATGTWNSYDLCFANCNYNFENVVFEKAIALSAANKAYDLKNVSITETHDYYAIWVSAKGQNITIDGLTIDSAGRGIKIDEQYVDAPAKVTLSIANSTIKSVKKAAIVVKSVAGAEINVSNLDITNVAADDTFAVWVDENSAAYADLVVVNGAPSKVEGAASVLVYTVEDLNNLKATNAYVVLKADLDFQGAAMTKPIELWKNSTFDGNGHKISNVKTAVQGGYATSLFRGDANPGNKVVKNLVVENLTTPAGYSYAAAIWSDLQGANIEIENVQINNSTIAAKGTIGGFVGFVSASSTSVVIKNSSINNTNLNGGEADHKRGAVVGRAYGCKATLEKVVVDNVKINDVAATTSTLVGDKGYEGTVTVK